MESKFVDSIVCNSDCINSAMMVEDDNVNIVDDGFILSSNNKRKKRNNNSRKEQQQRQIPTAQGKQKQQSGTKGFGKWAKPTVKTDPSVLIIESKVNPNEEAIVTNSNQEFMMPKTESQQVTNIKMNDDNNTEESNPFHFPFKSDPSSSSSLMSSLLEEYGTCDPNWMKVEPIVHTTPSTATNDVIVPYDDDEGDDAGCNIRRSVIQEQNPSISNPQQNRLQMVGHAPIHIEFISFGYKYGIPSDLRNQSATGNSFSQPLVPFDTRTIIEPIPQYLLHFDGKSGIVKSTLLKWNAETSLKQSKSKDAPVHHNYRNVREYIKDNLLPMVVQAIVDAIYIGEHGYISPLTMKIYIGSEHGKHRSVVTCELVGTALRQVIRTGNIHINNKQYALPCSLSVGCQHRDIQQNQGNKQSNNKALSKKQKAFEDE